MSETKQVSYDELLGHGVDLCLERLKLVQGAEETNWQFRKRAFPTLWKEVSSNFAMDFLLMQSQELWPKGEKKKYLELLASKPSLQDLEAFSQEYPSDPLVIRMRRAGTKSGTDWIANQIVESRQPKLKKPVRPIPKEKAIKVPAATDPIEKYVVGVVAREFGVDSESVFSRTRDRKVVLARQVAMYLLHKSGLQQTKVGLLFQRNSTTVNQACQKIEKIRKSNVDIRRAIASIREEISGSPEE